MIRSSVRGSALGVGLALAYVVVGLASLGPERPLRPFFDGSAPSVPAFRYVTPPPNHVGNEPPEGGSQTVTFEWRDIVGEGRRRQSSPGTMTTPDGQVSLSIPAGVFAPVRGESGVTLTVTPLDPATVGEPPQGADGGRLEFEGNAVRVVARLEPSGVEVQPVDLDCSLGGCIGVVVRYPVAATQLWRQTEDGWVDLDADNVFQTQSLFTSTPELSTFVPTVIPAPRPSQVREIVALGLGGLAVVGAVVLQRVRTRRSRSRQALKRRRPNAKGGKGRPGQQQRARAKGATQGKRRR